MGDVYKCTIKAVATECTLKSHKFTVTFSPSNHLSFNTNMTIEELKFNYSESLTIDGHDDAIVGVASQCGGLDVFVYDQDKIIQKLTEDMTYEEAVEHFDFNIAGAYVGKTTPMFITFVDKGDY